MVNATGQLPGEVEVAVLDQTGLHRPCAEPRTAPTPLAPLDVRTWI